MKTLLPLSILLLLAGGCGRGQIDMVGTLERTRLELAAPISEVILEVPCREGQNLKKGDIILQFDPAITRGQYEAAAAQAAMAELDLRRGEKLFSASVISQEEFDRLFHLAAEKNARADELKARLDQLTLRAPADAVVDELPYKPGERPKPGDVAAVLLAREIPYARVYLPEAQMPHVKPGDEAEVRIDGLDVWLKARVRKVAQTASFTPHFALTDREKSRLVFETEIDVIDERARELRIGAPLQVRLFLNQPRAGK